jgi:hypothetical protein
VDAPKVKTSSTTTSVRARPGIWKGLFMAHRDP